MSEIEQLKAKIAELEAWVLLARGTIGLLADIANNTHPTTAFYGYNLIGEQPPEYEEEEEPCA